MSIVLVDYPRWIIAAPVHWRSRAGYTHYTMDDTNSCTRREAIRQLHEFYAEWSDGAPEKSWTWKQFYDHGYRAVRIREVLA